MHHNSRTSTLGQSDPHGSVLFTAANEELVSSDINSHLKLSAEWRLPFLSLLWPRWNTSIIIIIKVTYLPSCQKYAISLSGGLWSTELKSCNIDFQCNKFDREPDIQGC